MPLKCSQNSVTFAISGRRQRDCRASALCVDDPTAGERPVLPLGLLEDDHHVVRIQARRCREAADEVGKNLALDFDAAAHESKTSIRTKSSVRGTLASG